MKKKIWYIKLYMVYDIFITDFYSHTKNKKNDLYSLLYIKMYMEYKKKKLENEIINYINNILYISNNTVYIILYIIYKFLLSFI